MLVLLLIPAALATMLPPPPPPPIDPCALIDCAVGYICDMGDCVKDRPDLSDPCENYKCPLQHQHCLAIRDGPVCKSVHQIVRHFQKLKLRQYRNFQCGPNRVYKKCGCKEGCGGAPPCDEETCTDGCFCRHGFVLDDDHNCIPKKNCPKPGECPPSPIPGLLKPCIIDQMDQCATDGHCFGEDKCCPDPSNCNKICRPPRGPCAPRAPVRPGCTSLDSFDENGCPISIEQCPPTDCSAVTCLVGFPCQIIDGFAQCAPAEVPVCPHPPPMENWPRGAHEPICKQECSSNDECRPGTGCCDIGCGSWCRKLKPHRCEPVEPAPEGCFNHLSTDANGCTVAKVICPPGSCPAPDSFGRVCVQFFNQCEDSKDCVGVEGRPHCCLHAGCGKECVPGCPPLENPDNCDTKMEGGCEVLDCPPPPPTCANVLCRMGHTCIETPEGPLCVPLKPKLSCDNVRCGGDRPRCVMIFYKPVCVPDFKIKHH